MAWQLWTRRGLAAARRRGAVIAGALRGAGLVRLRLDETGFACGEKAWRFAQGLEIEATADLVYAWPREGAPLVWPTRAFATPEDAAAFLAYARACAG